jgi:hypothetical protein
VATRLFSPFQQHATDILRPIINPNGSLFPPPFNDPIKATDDPFGWQRKFDLDTKALTVKVIQHVQ